jgi:hypothetical protein
MNAKAYVIPAAAAVILLACNLTGQVKPPTQTPVIATSTRPPAASPTLPPPPQPTPTTPVKPTAAPPSPTVIRPPSTPTLTSGIITPLAVQAKLVKEESKAPPLIMQIRYPSFSGSPAKAVENLNLEVGRWINRWLADFTNLVKTCAPPPGMEVGPNSLYLEYEVVYNNRGLVSIYFTPSTYCQGAAHPLPWSETLTYDLAKDRVMQLADLFKPGAAYLPALSQRCIAELKKRDEFQSEEGALPSVENYKSWNITPGGLRITFDPYQVAAYAAGYQQVTLPWDSLRDLLNPAFQP